MSGGGATGILVNPLGTPGWNFQTFGYWLTVTGLPANMVGNISAGRPTPGGSVPSSGATLAFNGISGGIYIDPSGALQEHAGTMTATVNPGARTITFSTTGTTIRPWQSGGVPIASALDISGTLTYAPGTNRFTGSVNIGTLSTATLSGTVDGEFFGPNAEEIGGTISLVSNAGGSVESITGGFGGKR